MKKILFIVSLHNFDYESFFYAKQYLEKKEFEVVLASKTEKTIFEKETQSTLEIDLNKEEIQLKEFSAVFLISETSSSKNYLGDATVNDILNDCARYNIFSGTIYKESKKEIKDYLDGFLEIL